VSEANGLIVILSGAAEEAPSWGKVINGQIVSRSASAVRLGAGDTDDIGTVMLVLPASAVTLRRVDLPSQDLSAAQARSVAQRMAREASIDGGEGLHVVVAEDDARTVAVIAREDMAHYLAWAQEQGLEPDIITPAGALLPEPETGYGRADIGGATIIRGQGLFADASQHWVRAHISDAQMTDMDRRAVDAALVDALVQPSLNMRSGEFARPRKSAVTADYWTRLAIWVGCMALATLLISLVLIAKYQWSASQLDDRALEAAQSVLPAASDSRLAQEELGRMLSAQGATGYGFTGPVAGLMRAMQSVPGVSFTTLGRGDDGLVHATLASARADDINAVLIAVQAAGYRITATSSADPSGRVVAQITVAP